MGLIYWAISILGFTAIIGMYLLSLILRNKEIPKAATLVHGIFAVLAVILLIIYSIRQETGPIVSIVVFVVAAFLGIVLNYRDITGKSLPKWLAISHGIVAVAGFAILILFAFF